MQKAVKKPPPLITLYRHKAGCACWTCVNALGQWVADGVSGKNKVSLAAQCDDLLAVIEDYDLPHLLPALKTLEWVRDNGDAIKQKMTE